MISKDKLFANGARDECRYLFRNKPSNTFDALL
jgi:hypothetical protein